MFYDFERLIKKYEVDCILNTVAAGSWSAGEWQSGTGQNTTIKGAIVPITERSINNSGGNYKSGDCEFITRTAITITDSTYLLYKTKKYKLEVSTDFSDYSNFYKYVARRVSNFD